MIGNEFIDCSRCPKLCCYALKREGPGFADRSNTPKICKHCDIAAVGGGCRIHDVLSARSRVCSMYTCHGVGTSVARIFSLTSNSIPSKDIQKCFRDRQGIAFYLQQLKKLFLEEDNPLQLLVLKDFCQLWDSNIHESLNTLDITLEEFVKQLNQLMKKLGVGYDLKNQEFCLFAETS